MQIYVDVDVGTSHRLLCRSLIILGSYAVLYDKHTSQANLQLVMRYLRS